VAWYLAVGKIASMRIVSIDELQRALSALLDLNRLAAVKTGTAWPDDLSIAEKFERAPLETLLALVEDTRQKVANL
jgi:hypothetical protein